MNPNISKIVFTLVVTAAICGCTPSGLNKNTPANTADSLRISQGEPRQYRAFGTHQCQSDKSIGHTCSVTALVTDCHEGYYALKNDDCCPSTQGGGTSIKFTLDSCGIFAQPKKQ